MGSDEAGILVCEVFASIQGESSRAGFPCVFVRLAGCDVRCTWCDTPYAWEGGTLRDVRGLVEEVRGHGIRLVEITGGEPLMQPACLGLLERLLDAGHEVLLETSGTRSIAEVPDGVHVIMDLKPPGSGREEANCWENLPLLRGKDEVKLVLASREDYEWARRVIERYDIPSLCPVILSPAWGRVEPADLAAWILADKLPVRLGLQLHKVIWSPETRGV